MKFTAIILRIKSFWTAFALSIIAVSLFSDAPFCTSSHTPEAVEISALRPARENIDYVSSDDYSVFAAVLGQIRSPETIVVGELVVDVNPQLLLYLEHSNFSEDTAENFNLKNTEARRLRNEFDLNSQVNLLSREEEALLFPKGEGGWDRFYQTYPKARGIIYFSSAGFNKNKDEAIVRVKFQSGYWSERNDFYSLKKIDGKWSDRNRENKRESYYFKPASLKRIENFGK